MTVQELQPAMPPADADPRRSIWGRARIVGFSGIAGALGFAVIVAVSALAYFGSDAPSTDVESILLAPSGAHVLGTDFAGRDNLHLLLRGGWDMIELAVVAGLLMSGIAVLIGLLGAYFGGPVDVVLVWLTDLWLTVPRFVLLLVIASLFRVDSTLALATLIALFGWPFLARQIRAQAMSLRGRDYVEAARLLQLSTAHIMARYLMPAIAPFVVISTIQAMTQAIYQQVGLAFFGLVPLEDNWGVLFSVAYSQNAIYLPTAAWSLLGPVAAICLLQMCLVFTSRGLEQVFDPRLRSER